MAGAREEAEVLLEAGGSEEIEVGEEAFGGVRDVEAQVEGFPPLGPEESIAAEDNFNLHGIRFRQATFCACTCRLLPSPAKAFAAK